MPHVLCSLWAMLVFHLATCADAQQKSDAVGNSTSEQGGDVNYKFDKSLACSNFIQVS